MSADLLKVETRQIQGSRANKRMRKEGYIPSSVCGRDTQPFSIKVKNDEFRKALNKLGRSAVFKLQIDGKKKINTMIKEMQTLPISNEYLEVTFQEVSLKEEIKVDVALRVINAEHLEFEKLILFMHIDTLTISGLPNDIPNTINIDGGNLKEGDNLYVKDIVLPKKITSDADPGLMVLSVAAPRIHAEAVTEEEATITEETPPTTEEE